MVQKLVLAFSFVCWIHCAVAMSTAAKTMVARSKSIPFMKQPPALTGKLPGDVGFDPLGFTSNWLDKDWSQQIVPDVWPEAMERKPVTTVEWMREAELKHCRLAMLAVVGWVAVDQGLRLPFEKFDSIPNSFAAHNMAVENGAMGFLLCVVGFLELMSGIAVYDQARGSGRASGEFSFDPLGLSRDPRNKERYALSEIKNGRLAMLAFSGIVTQAALFPDKTFPYF